MKITANDLPLQDDPEAAEPERRQMNKEQDVSSRAEPLSWETLRHSRLSPWQRPETQRTIAHTGGDRAGKSAAVSPRQ